METAVLDEVVAKHNRETLAEEAEVHTIRSKDGALEPQGVSRTSV